MSTTQTNGAWEAMNEIDGEIEAAELLVDLLDGMVMEDSDRTDGKPMAAKLQGQIILLFDAVRDRLKKANANNQILWDDFKAREVVAKLAPTPEDIAHATEAVRHQRLARPVTANVARRSRRAVGK